MTDDIGHLVLDQLRLMHEEISETKTGLAEFRGEVKQRLTSIEIRLAGVENNMAAVHADMAHVYSRLDRLERRVDLVNKSPGSYIS